MKSEMHFLFRQILFVFTFLCFLTSSVSIHAIKLYFARIAKDSMFMAEVAKLHAIYRNTVRDSVLEMFDRLTAQLAPQSSGLS